MGAESIKLLRKKVETGNVSHGEVRGEAHSEMLLRGGSLGDSLGTQIMTT